MKVQHHTQIICTIGPASLREATLKKMIHEGMDVARMNFSHGDHQFHQQILDMVRKVARKEEKKVGVLQDLEGYRLRLGELKTPIELIRHQHLWLVAEDDYEGKDIPLEGDFDIKDIRKGMTIYINDGIVMAKVLMRSGNRVRIEVVQGGTISSRKGVIIPELKFQPNIMTDKDKEDIEFGIKNKVDFMALSFVRNKEDMLRLVKRVRPKLPNCKLIAKVETEDGVRNIDEIIKVSDGVLVARGDLGVSLPLYKLPIIQKDMIRRCNRKKKLVITATQMLESMTNCSRPTRAEVSDVANAILDGSDYVMLSGETAAGSFPVKAVRMMEQIIQYTEGSMKFYLGD